MDDSGPLTLSVLGPTTAALSSTGGAPKLEEISQEIKTTSSARKNRQRKKSRRQNDLPDLSTSGAASMQPDKSYVDALSARLDPPLPPINTTQLGSNEETDSSKIEENKSIQKETSKERKKKRRSIDTSLNQPPPLIHVTQSPPSIEDPSVQQPSLPQAPPPVQLPPQVPPPVQSPPQAPPSIQLPPPASVTFEGSDESKDQLETPPPPLTSLQTIQRPADDPLLLVDHEDIREGTDISTIMKPPVTSSYDKLLVSTEHHTRNTIFQQQPDTRGFIRTHLKHHHHHHHSNHHHHHGNHYHHHGNHVGRHDDSYSRLAPPTNKREETDVGSSKVSEVSSSVRVVEEKEKEGRLEWTLSNGDFVLKIHYYIMKFITFIHGLATGISIWDTVVAYALTAYYNHSLLLLFYHHFSLGLHCFFLLLTMAIVVSLLDRFDIANISINRLKSLCQIKEIALGVVLLLMIVSVLVISTGAFLDSRIALYTKDPSLWSDLLSPLNYTTSTNMLYTTTGPNGIKYILNLEASSSYVYGWLAMSAMRSFTLVGSWLTVNLTDLNDKIKEYVEELNHHHHHHHHNHHHHHHNHHSHVHLRHRNSTEV